VECDQHHRLSENAFNIPPGPRKNTCIINMKLMINSGRLGSEMTEEYFTFFSY